MLNHTATLMQTLRTTIQLQSFLDATRLLSCEVSSQFYEIDVATTREHIHTIIIIEEERRIMICRQTAVEFPALGRVIGLEHHRLMRIVVGHEECPERTLVIAQCCSPLTTTIHRSLLQVITGCVLDFIKEIRYCLPMNKVRTAHDRSAREKVHRGGNQIIIVTYANDVRVWSVRPDKRILHLNF